MQLGSYNRYASTQLQQQVILSEPWGAEEAIHIHNGRVRFSNWWGWEDRGRQQIGENLHAQESEPCAYQGSSGHPCASSVSHRAVSAAR